MIKEIIKRMRPSRPIQKYVEANISYLSPNERLKGKGIIVTGGGHGLGATMAEKFISEGARVLIAGRNDVKLKETAKRIGCSYCVLDVCKPDLFQDFIIKVESIIGEVNVLVNNAGISLHEETFFDVTPVSYDKQLDTNLKGPFFLTQSFLAFMRENNRKGDVLFVSSEAGQTCDFRPYGFTKAMINSMVQGLAYYFAEDGYRINAIAPGITASDMTGVSPNGNLYYKWNMNKRIYLPEEVAECACFLISDAAGSISGQLLTCNNARTVNARWK